MLIDNIDYKNLLFQSIEECSLSQFDNKTILLSGCTGLIGSYIVDMIYFYNEKYNGNIKLIGINHNQNSCKKRFYYIDNQSISFSSSGVESFSNETDKIDFIIHAASHADPVSFARYPVETIQGNVLGTINMIRIAQKANAKLLFISSREVYGYLEKCSNYKEDFFGLCDFNRIRACYPESKRISEILCRSYREEYGLDVVIARLGYVYGPTQTDSDSRVVAQFIRNAIKNEDIVLKSAGLQRRSYTFVSDCVSALFKIMLIGTDDVYNVADENTNVSVAELAELIAEFSKTKVVKAQLSENELKGSSDNHDALLDCTKLKALGWKPSFNLKKGLSMTVKLLQNL